MGTLETKFLAQPTFFSFVSISRSAKKDPTPPKVRHPLHDEFSDRNQRSDDSDNSDNPVSRRVFIGRLPEDCTGRDIDDTFG